MKKILLVLSLTTFIFSSGVDKKASAEQAKTDHAKLIKALKEPNKNVNTIQALLDSGNIDVNAPTRFGLSNALITMIGQFEKPEDIKIINLLINAGASLDKVDALGLAPLIHAANKKDMTPLKALIYAGANINFKNGKTILNYINQENPNKDYLNSLIKKWHEILNAYQKDKQSKFIQFRKAAFNVHAQPYLIEDLHNIIIEFADIKPKNVAEWISIVHKDKPDLANDFTKDFNTEEKSEKNITNFSSSSSSSSSSK